MSANFLDSLRTLFKLSGTQALPSLTLHSTQSGTSESSNYLEILSPIDGWLEAKNLSLTSSNTTSRLRVVGQSSDNHDAISATFIREDGYGTVDGAMPVQKGQKILYFCTVSAQYQFRWYTTKGSE